MARLELSTHYTSIKQTSQVTCLDNNLKCQQSYQTFTQLVPVMTGAQIKCTLLYLIKLCCVVLNDNVHLCSAHLCYTCMYRFD